MKNQTMTYEQGEVRSASKTLQIVAAFLLGGAMIYGAGFVQTPEVHNATHDMRHAQGFPCH